jgi:hypothetical protein
MRTYAMTVFARKFELLYCCCTYHQMPPWLSKHNRHKAQASTQKQKQPVKFANGGAQQAAHPIHSMHARFAWFQHTSHHPHHQPAPTFMSCSCCFLLHTEH